MEHAHALIRCTLLMSRSSTMSWDLPAKGNDSSGTDSFVPGRIPEIRIDLKSLRGDKAANRWMPFSNRRDQTGLRRTGERVMLRLEPKKSRRLVALLVTGERHMKKGRLRMDHLALACLAGIFLLFWFPSQSFGGEAEDILKEAEKIKNQDEDFRVELRVSGDKESFKIGDEIRFTFKASKDCYVTLINIGPTGKPVIIFPNKWYKTNLVKAGKNYSIPPEESNYTMIAQDPKGIEMVKAIASLEPIKALEKADLSQVGNFKIVEKPGLVMKGIGLEVGKKKKSEWSTSEVVFSVESGSGKE